MIEYNVGIIGAGQIASVIADTLHHMNGFCPYAIASRDEEKAKKFAEDNNIEKYYGSYEAILEDPEVELVYVATVNSTHVDVAKMCIDAGKPVFVEKPISYNAKTAEDLLNYAKEKGVFCGEAMWLRYNPLMLMAVDQIRKNVIGDIRCIHASIGYNLGGKERMLKPELAGGALLDIGIYPLTAIFMIMGGPPVQAVAEPLVTNTGVDAYSTIYMRYPQGRVAIATNTMTTKLDNKIVVYGTHGRIELDNVNNPQLLTVYGNDGKPRAEMKSSKEDYSGYEYEFKAARVAAIAGHSETKEATIVDTVNMYKFTDSLRYMWNIMFPLPEEPEKRTDMKPPVSPNPKA